MIKNMNVLPLPVVSAIVARFDPDLDIRTFSRNDARIHINEGKYTLYNDGSWVVNATHISGEDIIITVTPDLTVTFEVQ